MFLGIDIGTSGVKATVVDESGAIVKHAYRVLTAYGGREGKRELDPEEVKAYTFEVMEEVMQNCRQVHISLVTISSLGEAVVPVGKDGKVLAHSIIGSDPRGADELEWIKTHLDEKELTDITRLNLSYIYSLNKILHIRKHTPDVHQKTWKYMCFTDYIGFVLTGETKIDYSMASRTMAFDIHSCKWSEKILHTVQIGEEYFSEPVPGGSIIGYLLPSVKKRLNITYDVPVMAGTHDHIFNALGAGAAISGSCSNIVGTTEGITAIFDKMLDTDCISKENISCEPFVQKGLYNTVAWHNTAGAMVNWYIDTFWKDSVLSGNQIFDYLTQNIPVHPGKLMVLPHFSGSTARYMDEKAKGAVIGLTVTTDREEIFKAVLEGASYECRTIIDAVGNAGITLDKIIVSGGGSKSPVWMKVKADILGRPVYKAACADTGALGGAILGAVVLGIYKTIEEASMQMLNEPEMIEPDMEYHKIYQERYEQYRELYLKLRPLNHIL